MREASPDVQSAPFMTSPALAVSCAYLYLAPMPALLLYRGETHGLMPEMTDAQVIKIVSNANGVLNKFTRGGGLTLWWHEGWAEVVWP